MVLDAHHRPSGPRWRRWHVQVRFAKGPYATAVFGSVGLAGLAGAWSGAAYGGWLGGLVGLLAAPVPVWLAVHAVSRHVLRRAAAHGDADAQFLLGNWYEYRRGVAQDNTAATTWYRKAAEQGHALAQHALGFMYAHGRGVAHDDVEAYMWFNLAASRTSGEDRDVMARSLDALAERMTPEHLAEARRRAQEWDAAHPLEP